MIKKELVDVCCRNSDYVNSECVRLESLGFVLTGQIGGGEDGSYLVYEDYENATEQEQCEIWNRHKEHKKICKEFWEFTSKTFLKS